MKRGVAVQTNSEPVVKKKLQRREALEGTKPRTMHPDGKPPYPPMGGFRNFPPDDCVKRKFLRGIWRVDFAFCIHCDRDRVCNPQSASTKVKTVKAAE